MVFPAIGETGTGHIQAELYIVFLGKGSIPLKAAVMKTTFLRQPIVFLFLLGFSVSVLGQNTYTVLIDSDGPGTGCDVSIASLATTLPGIDKRLTANVDTNTFQITDVALEDCTGAAFGASVPVGGGYPAALNTGVGGADAIEMAVGLAPLQLSPITAAQVYVLAVNSDTGATDLLNAGLAQRPIPGSGVPVPTAGTWGLMLAGALLLLTGLLFIRRNRVVLGIALVSLSMVAFAANFNADGNLDDWQGESPQSTDPVGDPVPNNSGVDITTFFQAFEANRVFFRIDITDLENTPPVADEGADSTLEDTLVSITLSGSDADTDPLTFAIDTPPGNGVLGAITPVDATSATVDYTPDLDFNGVDSFTFMVNDGNVDSPPATVDLTVTAVNDAPGFTPGANVTAVEDSGANTRPGWASGISAGPANEAGQTVSFSITGNDNPGLFSVAPAINAAGDLSFTPTANTTGIATITVEAMDSGGTADGGVDTSAPIMFTIMIDDMNDEPSFTAGADEAVLEDAGPQSVLSWATGISAGPPNEAGQIVSFNVSNDNSGLFSAQPAVDSAGTLTYTPAADANGSATVTMEAMDDGGTANGGDDTSPAQMFSITVNAVNDEPGVTPGSDQVVNEDAGAQTVMNFAVATPGGGADESAQTFTYLVSNDNNGLFSAQPAIDSSGQLTYTPAADTAGSAVVTVQSVDSGGTADGGDDTSQPAMFMITVNSLNDPPSFTAGANESVDEDAGVQSVPGWATGISPGPADEAGQAVSFNLSNDNNALFSAQPAVDSAGTLSYTPADNASGSATVTVEAMDDGGTPNGGSDTSAAQMFTVTVSEVNDPPVLAAIGDQSIDELMQLSFMATATDPNDTPANNLTFTLSGEPAGASITAAGLFTWTPTEAQGPGMFSFDVVVTDDGTPNEADSETITVTVNEVNQPPTLAMIGNQMGDELTNITFTAMATDPDLPAQTLTFSLSGEPAGAGITGGGAFSWTPTDAQGPGMYTFDVIVTDDGPGLLTDSETITIDVAEVNAPPVADNEAYTVTGNVGISVNAASGLLVGDTDPDTPMAITATAETVASANAGSATIAADGSFTYTPPAGFTGMDSFSYTLNDNDPSGNLTDTGTVTLTVSDMIWFIDNSQGVNGDGRLASPFNSVANFVAGATDQAGDAIFVYRQSASNYVGPLTLLNNQKLIGQGATASIAAIAGITPAPNSNPLPATGGTHPVIAHSANNLTVAQGNTLRGLNLSNTGGTALTGSNFGNLTVGGVSVSNTAGTAVSLNTGNPTASFTSISASGGANGIVLSNTTGSFTVTGDGSGVQNGSGGTIQNTSGDGISLSNATNISLTQLNITDAAQQADGVAADDHAIDITSVTNFTFQDAVINGFGNTMASHDDQHSIKILNLFGTSLIEDVRFDDMNEDGIEYINNTTDDGVRDVLTVRRGDFNGHLATNGESAIQAESAGTSNMGLVVDNATFDINANGALGVLANSTGTSNFEITVQNSTFSAINAFGGGTIQTNNATNSTSTIMITGNTITGAEFNGITILNNDDATTNVTVSANDIRGDGTMSQNGFGLRISQDENGTVNSLIDDNDFGAAGGSFGFDHIRLEAGDTTDNTGILNATVTNNVSISVPNDIGAGLNAVASENNTICVDIRSNTLLGSETFPGFGFDDDVILNASTAGATVRAEQTSTANITALNTITTIFTGGTGTVSFSSPNCPTP